MSTRQAPKKRKSNKGLMIAAVILVVALVGVGFLIFSVLGSGGGNSVVELPVVIEVPEGASTSDVAELLKKSGVVRSTSPFIKEVKNAGLDGKIQAGAYSIPSLDVKVIVETFAAGANANMAKLVIPEGLSNKQIADRVEETLGIPAKEFLAIANEQADKYADDYIFLEGAYKGSMEGYLFPKTYMIPEDANAEYVINTLLTQFRKEYASVDTSWAEAKGYPDADIVIVASMIERETRIPEERELVSSVIYNRLDEPMRLQMCSTVEYLLGTKKTRLSEKDIAIDSPYNTYINDGLPPAPISNPGLDSLNAAANPAKTKYLYYVLTGEDGSQTFSKTLEEHNAAKTKSKQVLGE